MATQPPAGLPIFYKDLQPLSNNSHRDFKLLSTDKASYLAGVHAIPLTIDEFIHAQRFFPIVFSTGENPVPLALMGLNEGVNVFVDDEGKPYNPIYIPAYVRRYPFMLARSDPNAQELTLCFDPTSDVLGEGESGEALFDGDKPAAALNAVLKFCEDFEIAAQRTGAFVKELAEMNLLIDGELSIQPNESDQPFVYRGFQMVAEEKLRDLHGDQLRRLNQNGILPLIMAHMFSLSLATDVFARQMALGKTPAPTPAQAAPEPAEA